MGACLSRKYGRYNQDLTGSTFSHYSLNSDSSYLDLYPTLRYAETGASLTEVDSIQWRSSSVPLIADWGSHGNLTHLDHIPNLRSPAVVPYPALRPSDSLTTISLTDSGRINGRGREDSGPSFYWAGKSSSNGLVTRFQNSSTFLLSWESRGGGMVRRLRRTTTLQYEKMEGDQGEYQEGHRVASQEGRSEEQCEQLGCSVHSLEETVDPDSEVKYLNSSSCDKF